MPKEYCVKCSTTTNHEIVHGELICSVCVKNGLTLETLQFRLRMWRNNLSELKQQELDIQNKMDTARREIGKLQDIIETVVSENE